MPDQAHLDDVRKLREKHLESLGPSGQYNAHRRLWYGQAIADLAAGQELLEAEVERLQALVRRTLDGKPIVNGMKVWQPANRPFSTIPWPAQVRIKVYATDGPYLVAGDPDTDIDPEQCYSTREAAAKAAEEE